MSGKLTEGHLRIMIAGVQRSGGADLVCVHEKKKLYAVLRIKKAAADESAVANLLRCGLLRRIPKKQAAELALTGKREFYFVEVG